MGGASGTTVLPKSLITIAFSSTKFAPPLPDAADIQNVLRKHSIFIVPVALPGYGRVEATANS